MHEHEITDYTAELSAEGCAALPGDGELRSLSDRRLRSTPMLCRYTIFGGRRRGGRREGENEETFVDQHGALLLVVVLWLAALNFLDAFFTVLFLSYGGTEMNLIVDLLLREGIWPFLLAKSLGVGLCATFLVLTKNFRASRIGLGILVTGYSALLGWHLLLLTRIPY